MSKISSAAASAITSDFRSKKEAFAHAQFVLGGKKTITRQEATKLFGDAADELDAQYSRMARNQEAVVSAEIEIAKHAKALIARAKDLAGQVGSAMERIDKIVVKDFEQKLNQLERFVEAMKALDELKRSGRLDDVVGAFSKQK